MKATLTGAVDSAYATSATCVVLLTAGTPASITVPATDLDGVFTVSWPASSTSGVTYKLERADNGGAFTQVYSGTALTFAVSGLADGSYAFQVKATRTGYVDSGYQSGTCLVTVTTVGAPASIDGVPLTSTTGSFTVSWPASSTAGVTYKLERSTNGGAYAQVYSGTALSYAASNLANGSYVFRVKATLTGSVDSAYATSATCVVLLTAATPASITVPATDLDGVFTVSWGASTTTSVTYVLERADNGGAFTEAYRGTAWTFAVSGLVDGSYAFQVKATRTGYVDSGYQSGTCLVTVTTVGAPASISGVPETSTTGSFTVSWPASSTGGVTYKLERSTNGGSVHPGVQRHGAVLRREQPGERQLSVPGEGDADGVGGQCLRDLGAVRGAADGGDAGVDHGAGDGPGRGVHGELGSLGHDQRDLRAGALDDNGGAFTEVYRGTARTLAVSGLTNGSYAFQVKAVRTGYVDSGFQSGTCLVSTLI